MIVHLRRLFVRSEDLPPAPPAGHAALTVGVCKGQGDTERVEGGRAEMDTAGASKGYTNEVIIIYYLYNKVNWYEDGKGTRFSAFPF